MLDIFFIFSSLDQTELQLQECRLFAVPTGQPGQPLTLSGSNEPDGSGLISYATAERTYPTHLHVKTNERLATIVCVELIICCCCGGCHQLSEHERRVQGGGGEGVGMGYEMGGRAGRGAGGPLEVCLAGCRRVILSGARHSNAE